MIKCSECDFFQKFANTDECGKGACTFRDSHTPVNVDDDCHYLPSKDLYCIDCDRFGNDTACMTCEPTDNASLCAGFLDKHEVAVTTALLTWKLRGEDYRAKLEGLIQLVETAQIPGVPRKDKE